MTIYFTSSVTNGNTEAINPGRVAEYEARVSEAEGTEGQVEHVIYIPNVGEFSSTDLQELRDTFGSAVGTIELEMWRRRRAADTGSFGEGNSGTQ